MLTCETVLALLAVQFLFGLTWIAKARKADPQGC